jgi:hypothetical protein
MPAAAPARAVLQLAAERMPPSAHAVVLIVERGKLLEIVADPADRAELPAELRALVEACLTDRQICSGCGCHLSA